MKHYETAVKFEQACQVHRLLNFAGKEISIADNMYLQELRGDLEKCNSTPPVKHTLIRNDQDV